MVSHQKGSETLLESQMYSSDTFTKETQKGGKKTTRLKAQQSNSFATYDKRKTARKYTSALENAKN